MKKEISIKWHIDDIRLRDKTLTEEECSEILTDIEKYHDANIGINWDIIDSYIDEHYQKILIVEKNNKIYKCKYDSCEIQVDTINEVKEGHKKIKTIDTTYEYSFRYNRTIEDLEKHINRSEEFDLLKNRIDSYRKEIK